MTNSQSWLSPNSRVVSWCALFFACSLWSQSALAQPSTTEIPKSWLQDTELTDAFFISEQLGWVVGEHGTILKTTDGGATWTNTANLQQVLERSQELPAEMQRVLGAIERNVGRDAAPNSRTVSTGINFRFESVHFYDEQIGIVVGGYDIPYLNRSRAVVMRTEDGGTSWKQVKGLVIPRLCQVRMDTDYSAWALGDNGNLYEAGVYSSDDGGQSWTNFSSKVEGAFTQGDKIEDALVVADEKGKLNVIRDGQTHPSKIVGRTSLSPITSVKMLDRQMGWAVGYGGQLLQSTDGGVTWRSYQPKELQSESKFDFHALTVANDRLWLAGNPGTYIVSVDLKTGLVARHRTPVATAINCIRFVSADVGWAVGDGGTILVTRDQGETWQRQRGGAPRVGLMTVSFDAKSFPLLTLAQYSSERNLASAAVHVVIGPQQPEVSRFQQAASRLGCNTCRLIYPDGDQVMADTVRQLALMIRSHRPNVVVCETPPFRQSDGSFVDPLEILQRAVRAAENRRQFSDQLVELGLSTWRIDRLAVVDSTGQGELKLNADRFLPSAGQAMGDQVAISAALLGQPLAESEEKTFRVVQLSIGRSFSGSDLFDGLAQMGKQVPIRSRSSHLRGNLQMMQKNVSQRNQVKQLAQWNDLAPRSLLVWRQKLNSIVAFQDDDLSGVWLTQLANQYMQAGKWQMAAFTLNQLVSRYSKHPFTPAALVWLAQYHASDEMLADRISAAELDEIPELDADSIDEDLLDGPLIKPANFQAHAHVFQADGMNHMVWVPDQIKEEVDAELAAKTPKPKVDPITEAYQQASSVITRIRSRDPDLGKDANVRFLEAQLIGRMQSSLAADNLFRQIVRSKDPNDPLFVACGRELRLHKTKGEIEAIRCANLTERPNLDGKLDDDCWSKLLEKGEAQFLRMTPPDSDQTPKTDVVILAHDEEFIYVAARCNKLKGYPYRSASSPRTRDANLSNRDRIEFALDCDRDYQIFLQFSVDFRGWCHDGCSGGEGWNPDWYIARSEDEKSWTVELAIPIRQICPSRVDENSIWGVSLSRRMGKNSENLWPTRSLEFDQQEVGLHRVQENFANGFDLMKFVR